MKNYKKYFYSCIATLFLVIFVGVLGACGNKSVSSYKVTFDDMNGNRIVQVVKANKTAESFVPDTPYKVAYDQNGELIETDELEDWTFYRWYEDQQFTSEYDFSTPVKSNKILYARWVANHNVSFDSAGGTPLDKIHIGVINSAEQIIELTGKTMEKEGYAFKGWYTDSAYRDPVTYPYILTGDKTLYAKWDVEGFIVTFYCINGLQCKDSFNVLTNGQPLSIYITNDGTQGIEGINDYINQNNKNFGDKYYGYTFKGWYTEPTFDESSKVEEKDYVSYIIERSVNFYGKFEVNNYNIVLNYNITDKLDWNGTIIQKKFNSFLTTEELMKINVNDELIDVTYDGKKLRGWYTNEECTIKYDFSQPITRPLVLYADWDNINGYIHVDYTGGLVGSDNHAELEELPGTQISDIYTQINLEEPVRKGYEFLGWSYQYDESFTCTWFKNGEYSCTNGTEKYVYIMVSDVYRWYLDGDPTSNMGPDFTYVIAQLDNKELKAAWEGSEYTVIFNHYDGVTDADHTLDGFYAYDSVIHSSSIVPLDKEGYDLIGFSWNQNQSKCDSENICFKFPINLGEVIDAGNDDSDVIRLYGVYAPKELKIIFNANKGTFGNFGANFRLPDNKTSDSQIIYYNTEWDYEFMNGLFANRVLAPKTYLARTDHQFIGWALTPDADVDDLVYSHEAGNVMVFNIIDGATYYAIWKNDAKMLNFNGFEYDEDSSSYINFVSTISVNIGTRINVYAEFNKQIQTLELNDATAALTNDGQFSGWYYCDAGVIDCKPTPDNRINEDTYITISSNMEFYTEYSKTKLAYTLVNTGISKYYTVSGLYEGLSPQTYIEVEIPNYYLGHVVADVNDGVFAECNDIVKLTLPSSISNESVKGKFENSLKIVNLNITKDVLGYLGTTGDSIFGENSSYMIAKISEITVSDMGSTTIENLFSSGKINLATFSSLTIVNGEYIENSKVVEDVTLNFLIDSESTFLASGRDGYPSAYKAGYTFNGWREAVVGESEDEYVLYVYTKDEVNLGTLDNTYIVSGDIVDISSNITSLNGKYFIAEFEKWNNVLTIIDVDGIHDEYVDDKYSGEAIYSDTYGEFYHSDNSRFVGFFYDSKCVTPVLKDDKMPYTKPLTIYAKFISEDIEVTLDENNNLIYVIKDDNVDEVYASRYYRGEAVKNISVTVEATEATYKINELYIPASYAIKLNKTEDLETNNFVYINISKLDLINTIIYGSVGETVVANRIDDLKNEITLLTLYDILTIEETAFDEFKLLSEFRTVETGMEVSPILTVRNKVLYRVEGTMFTLVRVPISWDDSSYTTSSTDYTVVAVDAHALYDCDGIIKITVGSGVTKIGEYAFANMDNLLSIDGMNDVVSIANINAFENAYKLKGIDVTVGSGAFKSSEGVLLDAEGSTLYLFPKAYVFNGERIYYVPTNVLNITVGAFDLRGSSPIVVSLNANVMNIDNRAFYNISEFKLYASSKYYAVDNGDLYKFRTNNGQIELYELVRFADASGESMYVFPNTIESVNPYAFENASSLNRIIYDNKQKIGGQMQGIEKNILIGSFVGDDKVSMYENFTKIELYGYNTNAYISYLSTFTIWDVYELALKDGFENEFRAWLRAEKHIVGKISEEDIEISQLVVKKDANSNKFSINGVDACYGTGGTNECYVSYTSNFANEYENLKFSAWITSLGIKPEESLAISAHSSGYVYVGAKATSILTSRVNRGEIHLHYIGSKETLSSDGMELNIPIDKVVEGQPKSDVSYSVLVTKDIYLKSVSDVFYEGEKVGEDSNGAYKVTDNGILSVEPVTSYENLIFRGWYKQHEKISGVFGTRIKFPLMIQDIQDNPDVAPVLSAAFTPKEFVSKIKLKVDYQIKEFTWNGVKYDAPANTTRGYWTINVSSDGNHMLTGLATVSGGYQLYYRSQKETVSGKTYNIVETYHTINHEFFTINESLELYILPTSYMNNIEQNEEIISYKTSVITLNYITEGITKVINTSYLDLSAVIGSGYHAVPVEDHLGINSSIVHTGLKVVSQNAAFDVYNQSTTRTNVTIRVSVENDQDTYNDSYRITVGKKTYNHSDVTTEDVNGDGTLYKHTYTFELKDIAGENPILNAVAGGILDFRYVTIVLGENTYDFEEIYTTPKITFTNTSSSNEITYQDSYFYLTKHEVVFDTTIR